MPKIKGENRMKWLQEVLQDLEKGKELEEQITQKLSKEYVKKTDYDAVVVAKQALEGQIAQRDKDIKDLFVTCW